MVQTDVAAPIELEKEVSKPPVAEAANRKHANRHRTPQPDGMLQDAEHLLNYAVEAGIEIDPVIVERILAAAKEGLAVRDSPQAGELMAAITKLAAKLKPVTAETLRACREDAHKTIRSFKNIALCLAIPILILSLASFITAGISKKIEENLPAANQKLLSLHTQINATPKSQIDEAPPPYVLSELQQFAEEMRSIYNDSRRLNVWSFPFIEVNPKLTCAPGEGAEGERPADPNKCLELSSKNLKTLGLLENELDEKTKMYQDIRAYANGVKGNIALIWGAIGNIILPVLYALLGACAAVLRAFTQQVNARTFAPTYATPARFYIAGIGGGVVGLFNNVLSQSISVSPLAIAFLVGYATDIFFSFLENTTQNMGKATIGASSDR